MSLDHVELSPNSRISIHDNPNSAPGRCCMCGDAGGSKDRKFVDFGMQLDWYGSVYFCTHCLNEVAISIGFIEVEILNELSERHGRLSRDYAKLYGNYEALKNATRSVLRDCVCNDAGPDHPDIRIPDVDDSEEPGEADGDSAESDSQSNESPSLKGLGNISWSGDSKDDE